MAPGEYVNLQKALRLNEPCAAAFVGAGGKTTSIFLLARALKHPVVVTTTTHMGLWQMPWGDRWIVGMPDSGQLELMANGVSVITSAPDESEKVGGLSAKQLDQLHGICQQKGWSLLIEADGAKQLPLKAPAEHEPVIPAWVDLVVVVAGLTGLGASCDNAHIHHADRFASLSGLQPGERVGENHLLAVLRSSTGGLKNIPEHSRKVLFLNQADDERLASAGRRLADQLLPTYDAVMIARLATENENAQVLYVCEPIASVILAAGGSTRFGTPKLSLTWRGKSFIDNILDTISRCTFSQAVLVLNNAHSQLINITRPSNLITIINPNWQEGQASSIRLGVKSLPSEVGGVVFFLGDQPQIPERLVQELISHHACTHAAVIAPFVDGRRGNPVLFDRSTFKDLEQLQGDLGGRAIFAKYPVEYVPWHDASILLDVDTPEDYSRLLELE